MKSNLIDVAKALRFQFLLSKYYLCSYVCEHLNVYVCSYVSGTVDQPLELFFRNHLFIYFFFLLSL